MRGPCPIIWGVKWSSKKLRDGRGLGHRRLPIDHFTRNNQPKTGGHNGGEYDGEAQQAGGAGEAQYHGFGGL